VIILKNRNETATMRRAGEVVAAAIDATRAAVRPGATTGELDHVAAREISARGAEPSFLGYRGFPATICTSVNNEIVHGIPGEKRLKEGDLVKLDVGAIVDGFHADSAVTIPVGDPSPEALKLIEVTEQALWAGLAEARAGNRLGDIGAAVQTIAEGAGFSVVREYVGHGIGRSLHEEPPVPNYGAPGKGYRLPEGLIIAVEPMVNVGGYATRLLGDGWTVVTEDGSLSAHFEHTVAVTADGPWVLTDPEGRYAA
jgi:methionyl aminopeptidase